MTTTHVWITKETRLGELGEADAEIDCTAGAAIVDNGREALSSCYYGEGKEWHRTREAAIVRARAMVAEKIKSLEKQIAKLRTLEII